LVDGVDKLINQSIHPTPHAGIVFDIAKLILDNNGDIQESRMMRMGCDFTLMMVRACVSRHTTQSVSIHPTTRSD
jgi:glycine cleavage system regulatory protein